MSAIKTVYANVGKAVSKLDVSAIKPVSAMIEAASSNLKLGNFARFEEEGDRPYRVNSVNISSRQY